MQSTARLFIAAHIPDQVVEQIRMFQRPLKQTSADVKWVRPENMHITLRFLGDASLHLLEEIAGVMASAVTSIKPFDVRIREAGAFPNINRPRVLWLGVRDDGSLGRVAGRLNAGLAALGFESEKRDFMAHLTLGRVRSLKQLKRMTDRMTDVAFMSDVFRATQIHLIKSELKPAGAVYTPLRTVQFEG